MVFVRARLEPCRKSRKFKAALAAEGILSFSYTSFVFSLFIRPSEILSPPVCPCQGVISAHRYRPTSVTQPWSRDRANFYADLLTTLFRTARRTIQYARVEASQTTKLASNTTHNWDSKRVATNERIAETKTAIIAIRFAHTRMRNGNLSWDPIRRMTRSARSSLRIPKIPITRMAILAFI
jgi:hypothetical protein